VGWPKDHLPGGWDDKVMITLKRTYIGFDSSAHKDRPYRVEITTHHDDGKKGVTVAQYFPTEAAAKAYIKEMQS
jgi:hypothetical protein